MTRKISKVAQGFRRKLAQEREDIYYDKIESKRRQSNFADIDWLNQLAKEMWKNKDKMENLAKGNDSYKVLRYLQTLLSVTNHLVSTAKTQGMSEAAAKKYKNSLRTAIHWLAGIPGLEPWSEWIESFNNSLDNFQPRQFTPSRSYHQTVPRMTITNKEPEQEERENKGFAREEEAELPPGLFDDERELHSFPVNHIKNPLDPTGMSGF